MTLDLHDEIGDEDQVTKIRKENERQKGVNSDILEATGNEDLIFTCEPSLEGVLGIGRMRPTSLDEWSRPSSP